MAIKNAQSAIFSCRNLAKKFEQQEIFNDITLSISRGEKIGIVGPNGSGKTTLLKIIANLVEKDGGTLTYGKDLKIEYLPQVHIHDEHLSGGEIAKKILALIISSGAGLFLLDEPTNNLDVDGLENVERFIKNSSKTFIIISHDRMFLDATVEKIVELNPITKTSVIYDGNYSSYIEQKEARLTSQWKEYSDKVETVDKFNNSIDQRVSWMKKIEHTRKTIKNLPIHEREKPVAAILRDKEAKAGRRARIMKDRLERYKEDADAIEKPSQLLPLKIEFEPTRGSTKVFEIKDVVKDLGSKKLGPLNISIQYGDRIHIIGKNGAGKTTLLKLLMNQIQPDQGTIERGDTVKIGYIAQERWNDTSKISALEKFLTVTELEETNARKILNRFRLTAEDVHKDLSELSPGEYSRLVIAELVAMQPNCIILDEPSNHLDLEVLEELEKGLQEYTGTLLVVSHDRYFVDHIGLQREIPLQ